MNGLSRFAAGAAIAVGVLSATIGSSWAITINSGGAAPGTSIDLGTNTLQTIVLHNSSTLETDFFFTALASGTFSVNSFEGTSAGANALSPFSIELINLTTATSLGIDSSPQSAGSLEFVQLSGLPFIFGDNYELKVIAAATGDVNFPVNIDGNVTVNNTPLPGALPLMAGGLGVFGLFMRRKKRSGTAA
jgi:hypothetical protein